jgi:hypothetical protein
MESSKWNLSEFFLQNWNLLEWSLSEGIFPKIFSVNPNSFRMESFRKNLSEDMFKQNRNLSERNISEGIIQKESFRKNLSENICY